MLEIYLMGSVVALLMLWVSYSVDEEMKKYSLINRILLEIFLSWIGAIATAAALYQLNAENKNAK